MTTKLHSGLARKIGLLLLGPFCVAMAALLLFRHYLGETESAPAHINLAGRQRMLAVQLGDLAAVASTGADARAMLEARLAAYERTLVVLERGGEVDGRRVERVRGDPEARLAELRATWDAVRPRLRSLAVSGLGARGSHVTMASTELGTVTETLRARADALTEALQDRTEQLQRRMLGVLGAGAAFALATLLIGLWYARRRIVEPVLRIDAAARRFYAEDRPVGRGRDSGDEIHGLALAFEDMTERVRQLVDNAERHRHEAENIAASLPLGLALLDGDLRVLSSNQLFGELCGDGLASVKGLSVEEVIPLAEVREQALEVLSSDRTVRGLEVRLQHGKTGERLARVTLAGVRTGQLDARLLMVVDDVSAEERLRERARSMELRFREVIDSASDGVVVMDRGGAVAYLNQAAQQMFGYESEDIVGLPVTKLMPAVYRAPHELALAQVLETGGRSRIHQLRRVEGLHRDGHVIPIEGTISACSIDGELVFTGVLRDISERLEAEKALERTERSFRALIEHNPDAIAVHRAGRFVYVNPTLARMLGYESGDLVGEPVARIIHPDDREAVAERIRTMAATGETAPAREERFLCQDGSEVRAEVVGMPLEYQGAPAIVAIGRDVTERRQLTAKMMAVDRMVAIGTLAAAVGHEVNNPLSWVVTNLDLLAEALPRIAQSAERPRSGDDGDGGYDGPGGSTRLLDEALELVDEAKQGTARVRDIVRDLKAFSRADDEGRGPVEVRALLRSSINMAHNEIRHRARLVEDYAPVPPVEANEARLGQVFLNLLVNAAQAVAEGAADANTITVRTRAEGDRVIVEVEDTGSGVADEHRERLFEPFFTTKPIGQGTGLGLAICRQTVRALGGEITLEPGRVGRGTTARVTLPAAAAALPEEIKPAPAAPVGRARILAIDDEPLVGRALKRGLGREHDVVVLTDAREALAMVAAGDRFDVIFCDLMMPEMTGMELYAEIERASPEQAERMVFLTGGAFTPRAREFLQAVPNRRFDKPFGMDLLLGVVQQMMGSAGDENHPARRSGSA